MARKKLSMRSNRALESNQGDSGHIAAPKAVTGSGQCSPGLCGQEAACKYVAANNTYLCICPHDSSPPTAELRCPNRLTVPLTPRPIHNIIPPTGVNSTNASLPFVSSQSHHEVAAGAGSRSIVAALSGALIMVAMAGILTVLLALVVICWWRRKHFARHNDKQLANGTPVSLTKGFLEPDRYTANPQYTPCYGPEAQQLVSFTAPILQREMITFSQEIGQGCFGKVYRGELIEGDEVETVAVKVLKEAATKEAEEDFMREVEIMSAFKHPNILSLRGITLKGRYYQSTIACIISLQLSRLILFKEPGRSPCMVFEYMHYGDLTEVLRRNGRHFWTPTSSVLHLSKESLLSIALQIASGMRYLAAQRFVHRDLACRNCLVGESLIVKIADFGMSRDVYTCDYYKVGGSRLLPVRWMSPESVLYGRFTLESDVWSFGIVLWEIFSLGKQPYFGHSNEEVVKLILQGIILIPPEDCPTVICELMRSCWKTEPRDRMRFTEIYDRLVKSTPVESVPAEALPRPPPFTIGLNGTAPTLDAEDYLQPHPSIIREYLQPLPD